MLTPLVPIPDEKKKIKLDIYLHTSLWCLKRFYEGLQGLHKTFWGTRKKCENKNISEFFFNTTFWNAQDRKDYGAFLTVVLCRIFTSLHKWSNILWRNWTLFQHGNHQFFWWWTPTNVVSTCTFIIVLRFCLSLCLSLR